MSGLLIAVEPYVAPLTGQLTYATAGYFGPLNPTTLKITSDEPDVIERISNLPGSFGQALDSYSRPKPVTFEFGYDEIDPDTLSWGLLGTPAAYTQNSASNASASFTSRHDKWVALGKNTLTAFSISGKTENTDYIINLTAGLVKVLSTGTILDNTSTNYTYSCSARTGKTIIQGTDSSKYFALRGEGSNLYVSGERIILQCYRAALSPALELNFVSSDPVAITLKGTLLVPTGLTGPYEYTKHTA